MSNRRHVPEDNISVTPEGIMAPLAEVAAVYNIYKYIYKIKC